MSFIQVELLLDDLMSVEKTDLVRKLTDAMASIEGENRHFVTRVIIQEIRNGEWAAAHRL